MTADVAAVLDGAADLLERDGWCQRAWRNRTGQRCAQTALVDSAEGVYDDPWVKATWVMRQWIGESLTPWNDEPGRTASEVIAALRGAAASERAT